MCFVKPVYLGVAVLQVVSNFVLAQPNEKFERVCVSDLFCVFTVRLDRENH